jgi:hypothetical protein
MAKDTKIGATEKDAREMIRQLRECLTGLSFVQNQHSSGNMSLAEVAEINSYAVGLLTTGAGALDVLLTGSMKNRDTRVDTGRFFDLVLRFIGIVSIKLSDDISVLVLRRPTKEDTRTVYLEKGSILTRSKWSYWDDLEAQPSIRPPKN